jgi:hypothetical protein
MQEARVLEERFIYFKEFESSFEERELMRGQVRAHSEQLRAGE